MSTCATARVAAAMIPRSAPGDEGEPVLRPPRLVEPLETQLAPAGVAPPADDGAPAEDAEPRLVQEDDRPFALGLGMSDAEVERVLVGRPLEGGLPGAS